MSEFRVDLENQVAAKLAAIAGTPFASILQASDTRSGEAPTYPTATIAYDGFKAREHMDVAGVAHVIGDAKVIVNIGVNTSDTVTASARLGANGAYDLAEKVRKALSGFEPVLSSIDNGTGTAAVWHLRFDSEGCFVVPAGTLYEIEQVYSIQLSLPSDMS